ncbi:MAG: SGNH/GDSL hydrolase family protein [Planctomycetes bacterium]|nr:SGNH/GDSL hydrolase family protein [Planctomycetota bacterium]
MAVRSGWCNTAGVPSTLRRLALSLSVFAGAFVAAELGLRWFAPVSYRMPQGERATERRDWKNRVHQPGSVPGLAYELAASLDTTIEGTHIVTNSLGLRCEEPLERATPGLVRIALLGDSMAFGYGVQQGEDFPARMEQALQAALGAEHTVEVLNFAVSGYSIADELVMLRERALPLHPDVVVLAYCLNDPELDAVQPLQAYFRDAEWWQHSHLLRLIRSRVHGRRIMRYGDGDKWRALHHVDGPYWREVEPVFDEFARACGAGPVPLVAIVLPLLTGEPFDVPVEAYRYEREHEFVSRELRKRGFDTLDAAPLLAAYPPHATILARDDIHLTPLGHELVAHALCAKLLAHLR